MMTMKALLPAKKFQVVRVSIAMDPEQLAQLKELAADYGIPVWRDLCRSMAQNGFQERLRNQYAHDRRAANREEEPVLAPPATESSSLVPAEEQSA